MSSNKITFRKDNLDMYLKEVSKEYRKISGKQMPAEIILVGGAAILANYGFRNMTTDMDAIIQASSAMKEAINRVGDKYNLPSGWINNDFIKTESYSNKLREVSKHYKTFSNIVDIRTVSGEYLIAMKLVSSRKYKNDLSDIVGILKEHKLQNNPITFDLINKALCELYGGWEKISEDTKKFIYDIAKEEVNYDDYYVNIRKNELESLDILKEFDKEYPKTLKKDNINNVLENLKKRKNNN